MLINKDLEPVKSKNKKYRPRINKVQSILDRVGTLKIKDKGYDTQTLRTPTETEHAHPT
jgi:hypothetical protein